VCTKSWLVSVADADISGVVTNSPRELETRSKLAKIKISQLEAATSSRQNRALVGKEDISTTVTGGLITYVTMVYLNVIVVVAVVSFTIYDCKAAVLLTW